jgi:putative ABC transport system permease protein
MFGHERDDRDLDDKLRAYIDLAAAQKVKAGMSPADARRAALLESGGVEHVKEAVRDIRPGVFIENLVQDARHALRAVLKAPTFALTAVITLAIGIGAATAIFTMANGVLFRRLPMGNGDQLVHLRQPSLRTSDEGLSALEVADLRRDGSSFSVISEYHSMTFQLYGHGEPLRVTTGVVSDGFFDMLGVKPALGRTFRKGEEAVGAPPVVLLSHNFWMRQFRGDSSIVGATFTMNDRVHTVIGVLPPLPGYPGDNDIWMPVGACPFRSSPMMANSREHRMVSGFALLKPGVSPTEAARELATVSARLRAAYPAAYPEAQRLHFVAANARDEMVARSRPVLYMLLATAGFLLLIAVANVATLSLSRQLRRSREFAIRMALGASRLRLYRQLALESLLLTTAGGVIGVGIAAGGVGLLRMLAARLTPRAGEITMSAPVFLFAMALSALIALVVAAMPFVHALSRRNSMAALRVGQTAVTGTRHDGRLRSVLVTAQVALAFAMLVGAGLIGRSLVALERVDAGVDVRNVLTAQLEPNFTKYDTPAKQLALARAFLARLDALPGVSSMGLASTSPLQNSGTNDQPFIIDGVATASGARGPHAEVVAVSPDYFRTVGIPLVRGRAFALADRNPDALTAIVSERMAKEHWGTRDPIGTRITPDSGKNWLTVVGVVGNVRHRLSDADISDMVYVPVAAVSQWDLRVFLRTNGPMPALEQALRAAVHDVDPQQPVSSVQTLEQVRGAQLAEPRLTTTLVGMFAALALILAASGLSGVVAYGVTQRLPEIGIRMALGATSRSVLALVMREGLLIVTLGLAIGWGVAIEVSKFAARLLFHVGATDLTTYTAVAAVLFGTALIACLVPSRRALRTDPARVFRGG